MELTTTQTIEILGTISFAISGSFAALQRRLDPFGVLIIAFVTSIVCVVVNSIGVKFKAQRFSFSETIHCQAIKE